MIEELPEADGRRQVLGLDGAAASIAALGADHGRRRSCRPGAPGG